MITLEAVSKSYGNGDVAVASLSLEIGDGELVVLVGPSGCGKTTTLRMINRLIEPTSGRILIGGENVLTKDPVQMRRGIGYVIQQGGLFPPSAGVRQCGCRSPPARVGFLPDRAPRQ
jgi:osmoprotectant transport system ATP-binding protein